PLFVWCVNECDVVGFGRDRQTFKDLQKIYSQYPQFNQTNTILLDDSPHKGLKNENSNTLHLPTYTVCEPTFNPLEDDSLLSVTKYFRAMHYEKVDDVRKFLSNNPFVKIRTEVDGYRGFKANSYAVIKQSEPTYEVLPRWKLNLEELSQFTANENKWRPPYSRELIDMY
ncbi:hypothetical protein HDU92_000925, partial [Lobulomyces angularis]